MSVMFDPDTAIYPFPPKPTPLSIDEKAYYREKIKRLLKERNAVMVAHYYTDPEIQQLATIPIPKFNNWQKKPVAVFLILWKWRASVQSIPLLRC